MNIAKHNVQALADRFATFNQQLITFVEQCSDKDWVKITAAEKWSVGVTAHHIGATHYPLIEWVQLIATGETLPLVTMAMVDEINRKHAMTHVNCTPAEVMELLQSNGDKALADLMALNDAELDRVGHFPPLAIDLTAGQLFAALFIEYANEHLASMKATVQA